MQKLEKLLGKILHHFFPNRENNYVPHTLSETGITILLALVFALFFIGTNGIKIIGGLNLTGAVLPAVLVDLTNKDRQSVGVKTLTINDTLTQAAKLKANDMLVNGYFAHTSPSGVTPWHWFEIAGYKFIYAGENLAVHFSESENVQNAWLNSPTHRANILNGKFTEIGIATVDGVFEGRQTTFVVELFGTPSVKKNITTPKTETKTVTVNKTPIVAQVAGVAIEEKAQVEEVKGESNLELLSEDKTFIAVENKDPEIEIANSPIVKEDIQYSSWYERFIVSPDDTVKSIYTFIIAIIMISIVSIFSREYKKHHTKHIIYGILLIVIIIIFMSLGDLLFPSYAVADILG